MQVRIDRIKHESTAEGRARLIVLTALEIVSSRFSVTGDFAQTVDEALEEVKVEHVFARYANQCFFDGTDFTNQITDALRDQSSAFIVYGVSKDPEKLKDTVKRCLRLELSNQMALRSRRSQERTAPSRKPVSGVALAT